MDSIPVPILIDMIEECETGLKDSHRRHRCAATKALH